MLLPVIVLAGCGVEASTQDEATCKDASNYFSATGHELVMVRRLEDPGTVGLYALIVDGMAPDDEELADAVADLGGRLDLAREEPEYMNLLAVQSGVAILQDRCDDFGLGWNYS